MVNEKTYLVETMPEQFRDAHRAARNWGRYPHNGAKRTIMCEADAEWEVANDPDGYARIVCEVPTTRTDSRLPAWASTADYADYIKDATNEELVRAYWLERPRAFTVEDRECLALIRVELEARGVPLLGGAR
jgi:hypothetical protein